MQAAAVALLEVELAGQLQPRRQYATSDVLRIDEQTVNVFFGQDQVGIGIYGADHRLLETITGRFDAALRTGRYDALFLP